MSMPSTVDDSVDYRVLEEQLRSTSFPDIYQTIVDAPFANKVGMAWLYMGFMCLYIVDEGRNVVQLMAASDTEQYRLSVERFDFEKIDYHLDFNKDKTNTIVQAVASNSPQSTNDWVTLNRGETPTETVRLNQANSGIAYTVIYPLTSAVRGGVMYNYYQYQDHIGAEQKEFMKRYTDLVSTTLEKMKKQPAL